jgi:hypothetical protein
MMQRRLPATPTQAVVIVATPEHQNIILWKTDNVNAVMGDRSSDTYLQE